MSEAPRNQLGAHAEALIADVLDKREQALIASVLAQLATGVLEPQLAVQKWIELAEGRRLRQTLIRRSKVETARIGATHA